MAKTDNYSVERLDDDTYGIYKNGVLAYNFLRKRVRWICTCPGFKHRQTCKHYETMLPEECKIKRFERKELEQAVHEISFLFPELSTWEVVGSYRRKKETSKDLDIIFVGSEEMLRELQAKLEAQPYFELVQAGPKVVRGKLGDIPIDIDRVEENEWAAHLLYRTGPRELNVRMREIAKAKGWKLSEHGLETDVTLMQFHTERSYFHALGLEYLEPEERS